MKQNNDTWQKQLAEAFCNINELCDYLDIAPDDLPILPKHAQFPMKAPRAYVDCIERGNPHDPLLRQILPLQQELDEFPGFIADPVGDLAAVAEAGVIHKYQGRALLIATGACAINCRYCFRRNFPYADVQLTPQRLSQAMTYIETHSDIGEIILSGGDPLLLSDEKLANLLNRLHKIPHIKRIRIHSRLPVVLPARITPALIDALTQDDKSIIIVTHANHGQELSNSVANACSNLKRANVTLLNQSVLLKGVNDNATTLCRLSDRLFEIGVLPYYLHLLDKAKGVGHFDVPEEHALLLLEQVKKRLPGYLAPKLVREVAGAPYKLNVY